MFRKRDKKLSWSAGDTFVISTPECYFQNWSTCSKVNCEPLFTTWKRFILELKNNKVHLKNLHSRFRTGSWYLTSRHLGNRRILHWILSRISKPKVCWSTTRFFLTVNRITISEHYFRNLPKGLYRPPSFASE